MSTKYKFHDQDQLYFVSFWLNRWLADLHSKAPASGARVHSAFGLCAAYSRCVGSKYAFIAKVNFARAGSLTTDLFYSGPKLDGLNLFTKTSLSLIAVSTGWLNAERGFDYKDFDDTVTVVYPAGWTWIGQTSYPIPNNYPNFSLNIATGVSIYNILGNTPGTGPVGVKIPILRSN